jgi:hypothetical protein
MNLSMIRRALLRHHHMKDMPAYREFLEHVSHRGAWLVPQREVARWWEARQSASLRLEGVSPGRLRIRTGLEDACVQVDGEDPVPLPLETAATGEVPSGEIVLRHEPVADPDWMQELLGHLGYRHVRAATAGETAQIPAAELDPIVASLRATGLAKQRFEPEDLDRLRTVLQRAHHAHGLPDMRLWTLPRSGQGAYRVAVSSRFDVDKAIVNLPRIHALEARFGLRSTVYLRPLGLFYGRREIRGYLRHAGENEIALHGEFLSTADRFGGEAAAARGEKQFLEDLVEREVEGVCMHGGELRTNTTVNTPRVVDEAGFRYETFYRNRYYLPLHVPTDGGLRSALSIGQHYADITVALSPTFSQQLRDAFLEHLDRAEQVGGVFVPVMHPLYFGVLNYLRYPVNSLRLGLFVPRFLAHTLRMRKGQQYSNVG